MSLDTLDYGTLKKAASEMSFLGKDLSNCFGSIYDKVISMHSFWSGDLYASFATDFNDIIVDINSISLYFTETLPTEIGTIAARTKAWDLNSSVVPYSAPQKYTKVPEIDPGSKSTQKISFDPEDANSVRSTIEKIFKNINPILNALKSKLNKVNWTGTSAEDFKRKFNSEVDNLLPKIENLSHTFDTNMNNAIENYKANKNYIDSKK